MNGTSWRGILDVAPRSARVLVVDDDVEIRKSVSRLLVRSGHAAQAAASAEEADGWLASERFDLCLLDIDLPRMSGLELLEWSLLKDAEMAVIILTGMDAPEVALRCLDHGARTFLIKPVGAQFLLRAVRDALALRRLPVGHDDTTGRALPSDIEVILGPATARPPALRA